MLASWFTRGLGQIVAPDEKAAAQQEEDDDQAGGGFWNVVAPDPNFEGEQPPPQSSEKREGPPPSAFLSPPSTDQVQCIHCQQLTPAAAPKTPSPRMHTTPFSSTGADETPTALNGLVLSAAKDTAESMISPPSIAEARNKVFRLCASSKPLSDKLCQRLKRLIQQDPSLIHARASHLGNLVPDGYTPLMAAATVNHVTAAKIILEECPEAFSEVDLQGRTALHIAAELGCMDMVDLLKEKHPEGPDAPVDLTGHTPLGRAVTSQHKGAKKNQSELQEKLFSPGDVSVCGRPTPAKTRSSQLDLQLVYGYADMPGFRVMMEDAISCHTWQGHALLGVCDGHGDSGLVSEFVAENVADLVKKQLDASNNVSLAWKTACLELDERLKETGRKGGSTAVWALLSETTITVANVGDSRCILIQKQPLPPSLEQAMENLTIEEKEGDKETPPQDEKREGTETKEEGTTAPSPSSEIEEKEGEKEMPPQDEKKETSGAKEERTIAPSPSSEIEEKEGDKETPPQDEKRESTETTEEATTAPSPQNSYIVTEMSQDHKPNLSEEQARIEKAGLSVIAETFMENDNEVTIHKVQRSETDRIAVSRSFGDFEYKANTELAADEQAVVAVPEIRLHSRDNERDMYLVLACDGVWDVMSSQEVGDFVVSHAQEAAEGDEDVLPRVGDMLLSECLRRGSTDNMTTVIVALSKAAESLGGISVLEGKALVFQAD